MNDDGLTPAQLLAQFAAPKDSGGVVNTRCGGMGADGTQAEPAPNPARPKWAPRTKPSLDDRPRGVHGWLGNAMACAGRRYGAPLRAARGLIIKIVIEAPAGLVAGAVLVDDVPPPPMPPQTIQSDDLDEGLLGVHEFVVRGDGVHEPRRVRRRYRFGRRRYAQRRPVEVVVQPLGARWRAAPEAAGAAEAAAAAAA